MLNREAVLELDLRNRTLSKLFHARETQHQHQILPLFCGTQEDL
jgi:hypothetical protein